MLLSSCVVWRYRTLDDFRAECPGGDPRLQRLIIERFDDALAWLESLGAPVVWEETGNPRTLGKRFDPRGLTDVLVRAAGALELETPFRDSGEPLVLATGGFQGDADLVRRFIAPEAVLHRANPWSAGDGLRLARERGAALSGGMDEFYGRAMPAPPAAITRVTLRRARPALRHARPRPERGGRGVRARSDLVGRDRPRPGDRAAARRPCLVRRGRGDARRPRSAAEALPRWSRPPARPAGTVLTAGELGFELPDAYRYAVHVAAGITHTVGGLTGGRSRTRPERGGRADRAASSRRASTQVGSRPAVMRAGSRRRSSSGSPPPRS